MSSILLLTLALASNPTAMAADAQTTVPAAEEEKAPWTPPPPPPDEFDWIQLNSGEWLKGEFKVLYDDSVEFDSDELGLQTIDWGDIKQVRGHAEHSIHFEGQEGDVVGNFQMTGDKVLVVSGEESREFNRADVISVVHGKPKESNYWSARVIVTGGIQT